MSQNKKPTHKQKTFTNKDDLNLFINIATSKNSVITLANLITYVNVSTLNVSVRPIP